MHDLKCGRSVSQKVLPALLFLFFCGYYLYRLFYIAPWYDELYTYLTFQSKGVIYSAIHWPLPNNHVFFSMTSALLRPFGAYMTLRGVSYISALGTLVLLYLFLSENGEKNREAALISVCFYSALLLPNSLAVQGRGYSLATFFMMLAIFCGRKAFLDDRRKWYVYWTLSLWLGLYTVISSLYYVAVLCVCFGLWGLFLRKYRQLFRLILASFCAAVLTLACYSILWLSIGCHNIWLTLEDPGSHLKVLFSRPFESLRTRFYLMKDNPYMSSALKRSDFLADFRYYFRSVAWDFAEIETDQVFPFFVGAILILLVSAVVVTGIRKKRGEAVEAGMLYLLLGTVSYFVVFLVLLLQSTYPFPRTLSFAGILMAIGIFMPLSVLLRTLGRKFRFIPALLTLGVIVCTVFLLTDYEHTKDYYYLDGDAYALLSHADLSDADTYYSNEIYGEQQILFQYVHRKKQSLTRTPEDPDFILYRKTDSQSGWEYDPDFDLPRYEQDPSYERVGENGSYMLLKKHG